jgi:hypothetical protein
MFLTLYFCNVGNYELNTGLPTLYLYTPHTQSLYERLGWSVTERCEYRNTNVVVMSKELIRVYDEAGNVIETHEHKGDVKER